MKFTKSILLVLVLVFLTSACSNQTTAPVEAPVESAVETETEAPKQNDIVRWNYGSSGNVMVTIADEKGFFNDEGITIEPVSATANANAMALLATGQVDVVSNSGTASPLQQIASGVDLVIFGGHMVNGAMPVVAKKGTEWKGIESFIGQDVAVNPSYFAFTGAVMELGYDNPLEVVNWKTYSNYDDALAAVQRGEVKYALMGTEKNYAISQMDDIEIVSWHSEVMPNYSCCRMECQRTFIDENPDLVKRIIKALLRAQSYYEANKDEAIELHAKRINATPEFVGAYMKNSHYLVSVDPLRNSVLRAWGILDKTGFLDENAKNINIEDHINTSIYEQALKEAKAEYGKGYEAFYEKMEKFYNENDKAPKSTSNNLNINLDEVEEMTIKMAHMQQDGTPEDQAMKAAKAKIEELSGGKIKIEYYPAGQIGSIPESIQSLQMGAINMCIANCAIIGNFSEDIGLVDLPYLLPKDTKVIDKVMNGPTGRELMDRLEDIGIHGGGVWFVGFREMTTKDKAINSIEDLKGVKMRIQESSMLTDTFNALGAQPIVVAYADTYNALANGTVTAQENPPQSTYTMNFYEVQNYMAETYHCAQVHIFMSNKEWYDGLNDTMKTIMDEAEKAGRAKLNAVLPDYRNDCIKKMIDAGLKYNEFNDSQIEEFKNATKGVYDKYLKTDWQKQFISKLQKEFNDEMKK